jgi:hypothetical protein
MASGTATDPRLEQLHRMIASRTFRNTEVLKRLFEYLGQKALAGETNDLKEYIVGIEAFGKDVGYDPKVDSLVRVQAGKLRQKIDEYYRTEGESDSVLIEFPKGSFALRFRQTTPPAIEAAGRKRAVTPWVIAAIALILATAGMAAFALRSPVGSNTRYENSAIRELWQPFFSDSRAPMVSLGAPLFAKISGQFFRNTRVNDRKDLESSPGIRLLEESLNGKAMPVYTYTGIGEASAAFELARLFTSFDRNVSLVPSNALTWEDIERHNVIFVGPPKYNLQSKDLPASQDFLIVPGGIRNLHPLPGEPEQFFGTLGPDEYVTEGYALIARLPGLHGAGFTMLISGPDTEGARAAVEYLTRPQYAARLVARIRGSNGSVPPYFQCVIRARFRSQMPIEIELAALRTSDK